MTQFNTVTSPPFQHLLARRAYMRSNSHDNSRPHALEPVAQQMLPGTGYSGRKTRIEIHEKQIVDKMPWSFFFFFLDLVWIRLFRPVRAIAEPWDEGDGIEWAKMAVDRVTWQWLFGMPTPALCRGRLPSHWRPPLPGGGSRAATYPVADSHQARVNDGRTEERGTVIQRINRDLGPWSAKIEPIR